MDSCPVEDQKGSDLVDYLNQICVVRPSSHSQGARKIIAQQNVKTGDRELTWVDPFRSTSFVLPWTFFSPT